MNRYKIIERYLQYMNKRPYQKMGAFMYELTEAGALMGEAKVRAILKSEAVLETVAHYQSLCKSTTTIQNRELHKVWNKMIGRIKAGDTVIDAARACNVDRVHWHKVLEDLGKRDKWTQEATNAAKSYQKLAKNRKSLESIPSKPEAITNYKQAVKSKRAQIREAIKLQKAKERAAKRKEIEALKPRCDFWCGIGADCLYQLALLLDADGETLREMGYRCKYSTQSASWEVLTDVLTAHLQSLNDGTHSINDIAITKRNGTYSVYSRHYFNARSLASALTR